MSALIRNLLMMASLAGFSFFVHAGTNAVHVVSQGETAASIAERYLGSSELAGELLSANRLDSEGAIRPGALLVVAGESRGKALTRMTAARKAIKNAHDAEAPRFAALDFSQATKAADQAEAALSAGDYDRAQLLASWALVQAENSALEADRRAIQASKLILRNLAGQVEWSDTGKGWAPVKEGQEVGDGARIRTGSDGELSLQYPGLSLVRLKSSSELVVQQVAKDLRTNAIQGKVILLKGRLRGNIIADEKNQSDIRIKAGTAEIAAQRADFILFIDREGTPRLVTHAGQVLLSKGEQTVELKQGFGAVAPAEGVINKALPLLAAPTVSSPPNGKTTASQLLSARWNPPKSIGASRAANYRYELASDPYFSQRIKTGLVIKPEVRLGPLTEGPYFLRVASIDQYGFEGPYGAPSAFTVKPELNIIVGTLDQHELKDQAVFAGPGSRYVVRPAKEDNSISLIQYRLDGGEFKTYTRAVVLNQSGDHIISARAIGIDGRTGPEKSIRVNIDAEGPEIRVLIGDVAELENHGLIRPVMIVADDATEVKRLEYKSRWGDYKPYTEFLKLNPRKKHKLTIRAIDRWGNSSSRPIVVE